MIFLKSKIKNVNNEGFACNNTSDHRVALLPSVFVTRRTSDTRRCSSAPGRSGTWACGHHRRWRCSILSAGWSQCWSELLRRPGWSSSSGHRMRTGSTKPLWGGTKRETGDPPVDGYEAVQTHQFWLLSACADASTNRTNTDTEVSSPVLPGRKCFHQRKVRSQVDASSAW